MIYYIGCERAREMLDGYVDGELAISEQIVAETHLRSCATCRDHVDDLRRIAASVRLGSPAHPSAECERALAGLHAGTIARLRAERDQAVRARLRDAFADMRLLWPALGAIGAVVVGVGIALGLLHRTGSDDPGSLVGSIQRTISNWHMAYSVNAELGSESRPLQFIEAMMRPQVIDSDSAAFGELPGEYMFVYHSVVGRDGNVSILEFDGADSGTPGLIRTASYDAVRDAASGLRFAPGLAADGSGVAVEMVMLMAKTTVTYSEPKPPTPAPRRAATPPPPAVVTVDPPAPSLVEEEAGLESEDGLECQECGDEETPINPELELRESTFGVPRFPAFRAVVA